MKFFTLFIVLTLSIVSTVSFSQGILRGTVYDKSTGEAVPFATVFVDETGDGTTTDLDGAYELDLAAGNYTLVFQFLGYADFTVSDVVFEDGKTQVLDVQMEEESQTIETVVVTAKQVRTSEAALATIKRKSTNLLDGISSQTFKKLGDSNAGEALKRVTGVSVVGGKHVYVRGLGDRYTKTILNGMEIPGLDPDRNSFEMDLLPTNLIDNILVFKSFTPNLPGDFTGGVVDVVTKDFPEERYFNVSLGVGYNPSMHFQSEFLRQERGGTDFLAMDDGTRQLPFSKETKIPNPVLNNPLTSQLTSKFKDNAGVIKSPNDLNKSLSISTGNQIKLGDNKYSYQVALNYKAGTTFYETPRFENYIFDTQNKEKEDYALVNDKSISGSLGKENILWSGLVGIGYKRNNHKFGLQALRIQNGTSTATLQQEVKKVTNNATLKREILEYSERTVTNFNLFGKHLTESGKFTVSWKVSPTFINVDDPDIRFSAFEITDEGKYQLAPGVGGVVTRTWRELKEYNISSKLDIEYKIGDEDKNKVMFGLLATKKKRDFGIQNYVFRSNYDSALNHNGEASNIFNPENIWSLENKDGIYARGSFQPANTFDAAQTIYSIYAMNEIQLTDALKAIYGLRAEKVDLIYNGQNNDGQVKYVDFKALDTLNILPSINLVYSLTEKSNLRASYNRTVARPTFKEKSVAQIQDRISGRTYLGNIDLLPTDIDNFDLRYEAFASSGQTFSVSGFYKYFTNPIELESFNATAPDNFQPKNIADHASVYGAEVEVTRKLGFISEVLNAITAGVNLTYVYSQVERGNADDVPSDEKFRPMVGQSPIIVNASAGYKGLENGLELNLSYNVQGKKLYVAGFGSIPDVYIKPFHSLNFKGSQKFGPDNRYTASLSVSNILDSKKEKWFETFTNNNGIFESLAPGRTFSLGISAKL